MGGGDVWSVQVGMVQVLPARASRRWSGCWRLVLGRKLDGYDWIWRPAYNLGWVRGGDRVFLLGSDLLEYDLLLYRR